jgi:hypothetical protein
MKEVRVNYSMIKIIGLLGEYPTTKRKAFQNGLLKNGYKEDAGSIDSEKILKDVFYPDFRSLMFIKNDDKNDEELLSRRFYSKEKNNIYFVKRDRENKIINRFNIDIVSSEIFLFNEQIGLFSLTLKIPESNHSIGFISDIINLCRNFDSEIDVRSTDIQNGPQWHQWISQHYLCGTPLRDEKKKIKVDEFSGSKFKVFSVIDCDISHVDRQYLLFDLGTSSPINSSKGEGNFAPHPDYFAEVMKNKISIFNNWESLCLFDSFSTIGSGILTYELNRKTWEESYFRIYLFRIFFKYNLYRYNSELHVNTVKLRNQFEKFLNNYNLSHISFNFLPNEIFNKIGDALHLDEELETFQSRINRISTSIQEEKQSRTNALLQFVSVLGGLGSVQPVFDGLTLAQKYLGWSDGIFYTLLVLILLGIAVGVLAFLMPELIKKIKKNIFNKKSDL